MVFQGVALGESRDQFCDEVAQVGWGRCHKEGAEGYGADASSAIVGRRR